jgi:hypothetical protein
MDGGFAATCSAFGTSETFRQLPCDDRERRISGLLTLTPSFVGSDQGDLNRAVNPTKIPLVNPAEPTAP